MATYRDLTVWQKSMDLVDAVYMLCRHLPKEEMFCLSDQMRRSAVSVPSNIAEGHKRGSDKEFLHFLTIAAGSCAELETQTLIADRQGLAPKENVEQVLALANETSKMLSGLYAYIKEKQNIT